MLVKIAHRFILNLGYTMNLLFSIKKFLSINVIIFPFNLIYLLYWLSCLWIDLIDYITSI